MKFHSLALLLLTACGSVTANPGEISCATDVDCPDDYVCQVNKCFPPDYAGPFCDYIVCGDLAVCDEGPPPSCTCDEGYAGDGQTCADVDECETGAPCSTDATCTNTVGGFACACHAGFTGDGVTCTDIDECAASPCAPVGGACSNLPGTYSCACAPGYFGDGLSCFESIGRVIWMGHDFFSRNQDVDHLIGNGVALATTLGDIHVLGYDQFADRSTGGEADNTDAAIQARAAELGRTVAITRVSDAALIADQLEHSDVFLVYEMEAGGDGAAIGAMLAAELDDFLEGGGIVIVLDHYSSGWRILDAAGVMRFLGQAMGYGDLMLFVTAPDDPLAKDVSVSYIGSNGTASYWTNDGKVVVIDPNGMPVVVHKVYTKPRFTGEVGEVWEPLATNSESIYSLMTDHPAHIPSIYNMYDATGQKYSPAADTWTTLAATGPTNNPWFQMAPVGRYLYGFVANSAQIWRYATQTDVWTNLLTYTGASSEYTMAVADESGYVYGYLSNGNLVRYNPATNTVAMLATNIPALRSSGSLFETRIAYDPATRSLFLGSYGTPQLYRYELDQARTTQVSSIPESQLNDIFCGDRAGHIYAAGNTSGTTMWRYDIATDTWDAMPDFPMDHGNNGTCVVSDLGYLYVSPGGGGELARLPLQR